MELSTDKLTTFLYLLMRDELPTGIVRRLIDETNASEVLAFSAPELQALATRYAWVLRDEEPAKAPGKAPRGDAQDVDPAPVEAIEAKAFGSREVLVRPDGSDFSPEMKEFLDMFDDRLRRSSWFETAVNEAASAGRALNEETAQIVGARIRELEERGSHA